MRCLLCIDGPSTYPIRTSGTSFDWPRGTRGRQARITVLTCRERGTKGSGLLTELTLLFLPKRYIRTADTAALTKLPETSNTPRDLTTTHLFRATHLAQTKT